MNKGKKICMWYAVSNCMSWTETIQSHLKPLEMMICNLTTCPALIDSMNRLFMEPVNGRIYLDAPLLFVWRECVKYNCIVTHLWDNHLRNMFGFEVKPLSPELILYPHHRLLESALYTHLWILRDSIVVSVTGSTEGINRTCLRHKWLT